MNRWVLKSESDTEKVYALKASGIEVGRYRYVYADGRTVEVGKTGLNGRVRPAHSPSKVRWVAAAAGASALVVADVILRLVG
jgi:hypothetical protein